MHPYGVGGIRLADDGVGLPEAHVAVPGKLGSLVLQSLRDNAETAVDVQSAAGKGMPVTIGFVHKAPGN